MFKGPFTFCASSQQLRIVVLHTLTARSNTLQGHPDSERHAAYLDASVCRCLIPQYDGELELIESPLIVQHRISVCKLCCDLRGAVSPSCRFDLGTSPDDDHGTGSLPSSSLIS